MTNKDCMERLRGVGLFILLIAMCACGRREVAGEEEARLLTVTLEPLRYFAEAVAGGQFRVVSMVPKGSSPETYDPTPQQLVALQHSQGYLRIGYIGFEQVWMERLQESAPRLRVFDMSEGVELIRTSVHCQEHSAQAHVHAEGVEPHIWNSARNALRIADNVYAALCELDSVHRDYYGERLDSLKGIIRRTDAEVRELLGRADSTFLIYHPALSYFARDYGLRQISIEEGGKEPSPARLKALMEASRASEARVIFVQQEFDVRNARLVADELGLEVVPINPLDYDWEREMLDIARALRKAVP